MRNHERCQHAAMPRRTGPGVPGRRRGARRRALAGGLLALAAALALAACTPGQFRTRQPDSCVQARMNIAYQLYDEAKAQLKRHYQQRSDTALEFAYNASVDSALAARSIKGCFDFGPASRREAINLIKSNRLFQKLVVSNMRDQDPSVVIGLYGEEYREIFKNDIR